MGIITRFTTVVRGVFSAKVRALEWRRPEAVYERALDQRQEAYNAITNGLAAGQAQQKKQSQLLKQKLRKLEKVEATLERAVSKRDMQNGPALLMEQTRLRQEVESAKQQLCERGERLENFRQRRSEIEHAIEQLKSERQESVAEIHGLQAARKAEAIWNRFYDSPEDRALNDLREQLDVARERDKLDSACIHDATETAIAAHEFMEMCDSRGAKDDTGDGKTLAALPAAEDSLTMSELLPAVRGRQLDG